MSAGSDTPRPRLRFWLTVFCFAIANIGVWVIYDHATRGRNLLLEITQVSPADQSVVSGRPTFSWNFNLDVTPTSADQSPGALSPGVSGIWKWEGPRQLTFTPDQPLARASVFRLALLPERLRTPGGFGLKKPFATTVFTQHLQVVAVRQAEMDERDRVVIEIEFNDDVIPADVLHHLKLTTADHKPLAFTQHGDAAGHIVRVISDVVPTGPTNGANAFLKVELTPGLTGRGGPLGMPQAYSCNLPIGTALMATEATSYFADHNQPVLSLRFNNQIDLPVIKPLISIAPAVPFTLSRGYNGIDLHGPFQPATRYAITIATGPAGVKRTLLPRPDTLSVFVPDLEPSVWFEHEEGYLGSTGNRTVLAHAVNTPDLRVNIWRVYDNNLVTWRNGQGRYWREMDSYSRPVATKSLHLPHQKNVTKDIPLALDELLPADAPRDGVYRIALETAGGAQVEDVRRYRRYIRDESSAVVTLSDIGLTAKRGRTALTVWATSLRTAEPLTGVRVRVYSTKNQFLGETTTSADGLASLTPSTTAEGEDAAMIIADRPYASAASGRDLTWLDLRGGKLNFGETETGGAAYLRSGFEAFIYTDRGVYRPGETVHLRAIVRGPDGAMPQAFPVQWQFRRPDLHDWQSVSGTIDSDGAVSLDLPLPDDLPTGRWSVDLELPGTDADRKSFGGAAFLVEDFIPNRMLVGLKLKGIAEDASRLPVEDDPIEATVHADYLFGKPVSDRPARLVARIDPARFTPAKWEGWAFGDSANTIATIEGIQLTGHRVELSQQILGEDGRAKFEFKLSELLEKKDEKTAIPSAIPWRMTLTASVIEAGGRAVSASRQANLDCVPWYIGLRNRSSAASTVDVALVAPDGKIVAIDAKLSATLYREDWNNSLEYEKGRYVYHSTRLLQSTNQKFSIAITGGKGVLELPPLEPGSYILRASDVDNQNMTSLAFYAGTGSWEDNISRENPEKLELLISSSSNSTKSTTDSFAVGQKAQVIVRSPFAGRLLLSIETDDLVSTRVIEMPQSHIAVPIDISDACRPNAYITATVVRAIDPNALWRTHRAFGSLRLAVDNSDRKLLVQTDVPAEIRPSTTLTAHVQVTDANGLPVKNAAVTVAAVDEGICQLTGFKTPDPFGYFTRDRALSVEMADLYSQLMPEVPRPDKTSAVGGDKGYDPRHRSPVSARRVKPVALVSSVLHTDANGLVQADFNVPQFTGKLRLMTVASAGRASGSGESSALIRSPLLVQSSWPRFAAPGDKFLVSLLVFNNAPIAGSAEISLHVVDGPLQFGSAHDFQFPPTQLAANGQVTKLVEVNARQKCGVSHVVLTASLNGETYSETIELPVRPASPQITLGGYATASAAKAAQISLPGGMLEGTGGVEIKITPRPMLQLPQGLDYLEQYPYGCLEQTTSTLFPLVYLSDIGRQIAPGMFEKHRVTRKVQAGITRLIGMQTASGGLAMWPAYGDPWPWGSVYAAHFVVEAQNAGFTVPDEFRRQLLAYVKGLLSQSSDDPQTLSAQAYSCYVLALAGAPDRAAMSRLGEVINAPRPDNVQPPGEARFHLAAAWLAAGRRDLADQLIPQAVPAPRESRSLAGSLSSPIRERAVLVSTLLAVQPENPALPDLVQQLADAGRRGQWRSTQDTAFAILVLGRYLRQSKAAEPYEMAELLLDGKQVASAPQGSTLLWEAGKEKKLPPDGTPLSVRISGSKSARAYVSWLTHGVPLTPPKPCDNGMTVCRTVLDERGKPIDSGKITSGDLVQIELSVTSSTPLQNLVIEDLLPAGLEIENPRLKTTAAGDVEESDKHQNLFQDTRLDMRDDRLVVMGNLTEAGTGTFTYTARAVTPGTFILPPARGECMYDNAINSISESGILHVSDTGPSSVANIEEK